MDLEEAEGLEDIDQLTELADIGEGADPDLTPEEMLASFYITGVTQHPLLDRIGLAVIAMVFVGTTGHGMLRVVTRRRR